MRPRPPAISEAQILQRIQRITGTGQARRRLVISIGDDAAAFRLRPGHLCLVSTDALVEGVHFDLKLFSPEDLGWKALAVNLSDIAAMGGTPLYVTTSIALPRETPIRFIDQFYRGLGKLARQHNVALVGGDTCASQHALFVDLAIVGEVEPRTIVKRSGARPGDLLYVTGELGAAAMGLELLHRSAQKRRGDSMIIKRQLRPQPRCTVGRILAGSRLVSAMIDVSDGLSTDLHNLCLQSQVGALIHASAVPVAHVASQRLTKDPLSYALNGGEDYELLFTVPSRLRKKVPRLIDGVPIHEIGHVTAQAGIWIWKGEETTPLSPKGFDHFETRLASSE